MSCCDSCAGIGIHESNCPRNRSSLGGTPVAETIVVRPVAQAEEPVAQEEDDELDDINDDDSGDQVTECTQCGNDLSDEELDELQEECNWCRIELLGVRLEIQRNTSEELRKALRDANAEIAALKAHKCDKLSDLRNKTL